MPRSLEDPIRTHAANATGFLNMLVAARDAGAERFVYAASSSTYGDHPGLPKVEDEIGRLLSPYAASKYVDELYAQVFHRCYDVATLGLRYFNVFGSRQDPDGAYAAVIPRWIAAMLGGTPVRTLRFHLPFAQRAAHIDADPDHGYPATPWRARTADKYALPAAKNEGSD